MKSLLIASLVLFAAPSVFASPQLFVGHFSGKGTYILGGKMTQCSGFKMEFSATANTFTFASGSRECDDHSETFYKVTMDYKDGFLYFGGQVVGEYDGNTLQSYFRQPDGDSFRNWRMMMRIQGNHLTYEESRTMDGETTPLINFAGLAIKN